MFGFVKAAGFNNIMAVKDYTKTSEAIKGGAMYVPFNKDIYLKLFENSGAKVDNVKELGKFIKKTKKSKSEVFHYWEGLIVNGYTLLGVQYNEQEPTLDKLCNSTSIKFVCTVK